MDRPVAMGPRAVSVPDRLVPRPADLAYANPLPLRDDAALWPAPRCEHLSLFRPVLGKALLLPLKVDLRVELFGRVQPPDLLAQHKIIRVHQERFLPLRRCRLSLSSGQQFGSEAYPCIVQFPLQWREGGGPGQWSGRYAWLSDRTLGVALEGLQRARPECFHRLDALGPVHREPDPFADQVPALVKENAVGNDRIRKQAAKRVIDIDDGLKGGASGLMPGPSGLCSADISGNGEENEVIARASAQILLPTWQLMAAPSPGSPDKEQDSLAAVVGEREWTAI